ncbi:MAG: DUF2147 domain-containing protein [Bacteroidales bacterium]|nr:DUF2147 domain-containing protein [Bacteroidales bacterium]
MMKLCKILALWMLLLAQCGLSGQTIIGKWKTIDDETGQVKSVVEIYQKDNKYYGKIVKLVNRPANEPKDPVCLPCKDYRKNQKIIGMEIITGLQYNSKDKTYTNGKILDPEKGEVYTCKLWLDSNGTLKVRGYVGIFYRTQTWHPTE